MPTSPAARERRLALARPLVSDRAASHRRLARRSRDERAESRNGHARSSASLRSSPSWGWSCRQKSPSPRSTLKVAGRWIRERRVEHLAACCPVLRFCCFPDVRSLGRSIFPLKPQRVQVLFSQMRAVTRTAGNSAVCCLGWGEPPFDGTVHVGENLLSRARAQRQDFLCRMWPRAS